MFSFVKRKLSFWQKQGAPVQTQKEDLGELSKKLSKNIKAFENVFAGNTDVKMHSFFIGEEGEREGVLIYVDGMVSSMLITESILKPITANKEIKFWESGRNGMNILKSSILCASDVQEAKDISELIDGCLSGSTVLLIDGFDRGLIICTKGWEKRGITEPDTEITVRGPREGFTENIITNTTLLRRKIKSPLLKLEGFTVGKKTATKICIAYLEGVARPDIISAVRERINRLNVDSILDSGYIEEYIEDAPFSIFDTIGNTEKPDVVAAKVLEGRIAIFVDGSPFVLTVPMLFIECFQSAEDYYVRPFYASIIRIMRVISYFITVLSVPIYIALTTHHQELIPTRLLFTIAGAREGTPFPAIIEAFILVLSFEILREAGLRLPRPMGQAISIVGALIMGDAAVAAGIVGAPMVITVAITAVSSFVTPLLLNSISIQRLILMVLASALGGYGIAMGFMGILIHLATLKSFGVPYFDSVAPTRDQQDSFVRLPLWLMKKRPINIAYKDKKRRDVFVPPPNEEEEDELTDYGGK